MGYSDDNQIDNKSDESSSLERTVFFSVGREAGKVLASYPFRIPRDPEYNFFQPFKGAIDYKLAHFFFAAHVPKTRIDEFFQEGFLTRTDANRCGSDSEICYGYARCIGYVVLCFVLVSCNVMTNMLFYARIVYSLFMHITCSGIHSYVRNSGQW